MSAIRLARGVTGRPKVVKFAGCYHGHTDTLLAAGGSGVANQGLSGSAGVPPSAVADTVVAPWNTVPPLDDSVAVVAVEPVPANMGLVPPEPGYLAELRAVCDRAGALLLFDEVITGYRLAYGGAQEWSGVRPDLWCFGKVIGGGLPVGAFAGSAEVMAHLAPLGPVYQAGTLSGNPLATAAGLAALAELDHDAYRRLDATAAQLADGLAQAIGAEGVAVQVPRVGPLVGLFFTDRPVRHFDDARQACEGDALPPVLPRHAAPAHRPGPRPLRGAVPLAGPHARADIERTVEAAGRAAREVATGGA